ncbi:hypothetical protein PFISCL1PPCAC_3043, partial [Pristionchus fissidentatus]
FHYLPFDDRFSLASTCCRIYRLDREVGRYRIGCVQVSQSTKSKDVVFLIGSCPKNRQPKWTIENTRRIFKEACIGTIDYMESELMPETSYLSVFDTATYDSISARSWASNMEESRNVVSTLTN